MLAWKSAWSGSWHACESPLLVEVLTSTQSTQAILVLTRGWVFRGGGAVAGYGKQCCCANRPAPWNVATAAAEHLVATIENTLIFCFLFFVFMILKVGITTYDNRWNPVSYDNTFWLMVAVIFDVPTAM